MTTNNKCCGTCRFYSHSLKDMNFCGYYNVFPERNPEKNIIETPYGISSEVNIDIDIDLKPEEGTDCNFYENKIDYFVKEKNANIIINNIKKICNERYGKFFHLIPKDTLKQFGVNINTGELCNSSFSIKDNKIVDDVCSVVLMSFRIDLLFIGDAEKIINKMYKDHYISIPEDYAFHCYLVDYTFISQLDDHIILKFSQMLLPKRNIKEKIDNNDKIDDKILNEKDIIEELDYHYKTNCLYHIPPFMWKFLSVKNHGMSMTPYGRVKDSKEYNELNEYGKQELIKLGYKINSENKMLTNITKEDIIELRDVLCDLFSDGYFTREELLDVIHKEFDRLLKEFI